MVILTRDKDFVTYHSQGLIRHGVIYIAEPITKQNVLALAEAIMNIVNIVKRDNRSALITSGMVKLF